MITIDFIHMAALDVNTDQGQLSTLIRLHLESENFNNGISYINKLRELKRLAVSKSLDRLDTALQPFIDAEYNSIVEGTVVLDEYAKDYYLKKYGFNPGVLPPTLLLSPIMGV